MSGVYLTVWGDRELLKPTSGGWPHITLAWTGNNLSVSELKSIAKSAFDTWAMRKVRIQYARVNTFYKESVGKHRHDVLLILDDADKKEINDTREKLVRGVYPDKQSRFGMVEPHITACICWSKEEADAKCQRIQSMLPTTVTIEGITI